MSDTYTFGSIVAFDETRDHEAKGFRNAQNPVKAIVDRYVEEYVNAFLNTRGGVVYCGVENDGSVSGIHLDRKQRDDLRTLVDQIVKRFQPSVDPDLFDIAFVPVIGEAVGDEVFVVEIHVQKGDEILYWTGSQKVWIRGLAGNQAMPPDMIERRFARRQSSSKPKLYQLPADLPDFIGRVDEVRAAEASIVTVGICLAVGMPGVGKTSFAVHVAHNLKDHYPEAQLYVNLRGSTPSPFPTSDAMALVLRALEPDDSIPDDPADLLNAYRTKLHNKKALLLFDDAADAGQMRDLVSISPTNAVLITSRHTFVLPGVQRISIPPLTLDESQALLSSICPDLQAEIIGRRTISETSNDDPTTVVIARLCGCLPIALRLAGSALAEQIDLPPKVYVTRLKDAQSRLELVDASFTLSFQSLGHELQLHWCALSVFPGFFDRAAVTAIWATDADQTQVALSKLASHSLIEWHPERNRYRLHDLARVFADSRSTNEARRRAQENLASHYESILRAASNLALKDGEEIRRGAELLDWEWDNIKLGQELARKNSRQDDEKMSRLCIVYFKSGLRILELRKGLPTRVEWAEAALIAARSLPDRSAEKELTNFLGAAYASLGQAKRAVEHHDRCLEIARDSNDWSAETGALCGLGTAYFGLGELTRGVEYYQQAIGMAQSLKERNSEARMKRALGTLYANAGHMSASQENYDQALGIAQEIGDKHLEAHVLESKGWLLLSTKRRKDAIRLLMDAIAILEKIDSRPCLARVIRNLGRAYLKVGKPQKAIALLQQAQAIFHDNEDLFEQSITDIDLGEAFAANRDYRLAEVSYHEAASIAKETSDCRVEFTALISLGNLLASKRNYGAALEAFDGALPLGSAIENPKAEAHLFERIGLANVGLKRHYESIGSLEKSVVILRAIGEYKCASHALRNLAETYFRLGDRQEALRCWREATQIVFRLTPGLEAINTDEIFANSRPFWSMIINLSILLIPINKRFQGNKRLSNMGNKALITLSSKLKLT